MMKIVELEDRSGVPRRTIRLYISRGLLPGPLKAGRDAVYSKGHLDRLVKIRQLQNEGLTLQEIARTLIHREGSRRLASPTSYWSYPMAEDVVVLVRADVSPWRSRHVRKALARLAAELAGDEKGEMGDEDGG